VFASVLALHHAGWPRSSIGVWTNIVYWSAWVLAWVIGIALSAGLAGALTWARSYESHRWWVGARPAVGTVFLLLPSVLSARVADLFDGTSIRMAVHWLAMASGLPLQACFLLFLGRRARVDMWGRYVLYFIVFAAVFVSAIVLFFTFVFTGSVAVDFIMWCENLHWLLEMRK